MINQYIAQQLGYLLELLFNVVTTYLTYLIVELPTITVKFFFFWQMNLQNHKNLYR
jgi:hypothetical protein